VNSGDRQPGAGAAQRLARLALGTLASLICLAVVEFALRSIAPPDEVAYRLDDQLIFAAAPGRGRRFVRFPENGGQVIDSAFDQLGFRHGGRDEPKFHRGGIFVYGDSFVQASYSEEGDTFVGQLSRRLVDRAGEPVRAVNAGIDGYGPDQNLLRLARDLPQHRPRQVILTIFADNDFGDLVRNKLFLVSRLGELERHHFLFDESTRSHYQERTRRNDRMRLLSAILEPELVSRDFRILLERRLGWDAALLSDVQIDTSFRADPETDWIAAWAARGVEEYEEYIVDGDPFIRLDNIRSDHYDADVSTSPHSESARYKLLLMRRVLTEIAALARRYETPLLVVIIPSPIDVCDGYDWQVDERRYPDYERRFLSDSVKEIAESIGVPHVNLFGAFSGEDCNQLYFHHGNNHWNDAGQRRAAALVSQILQDGWVKAGGDLSTEPKRF
jgi:lysophospholipase L1-like esterase